MYNNEQLNQYKEFNIQSVLEMIKFYEKNNNLNNFNLDLNKDNLSIEELKILDKLKQSGDILNGLKSILKVTESLSREKDTPIEGGFRMILGNNQEALPTNMTSVDNSSYVLGVYIPKNDKEIISMVENGNFEINGACLPKNRIIELKKEYIQIKYSALYDNLSKLQDKEGKTLSKDKLNKILAEDRCKPLSLISLLSDMKNSNGKILSEQEIQNILKGVINLKEQNVSLKIEGKLKQYNLSIDNFEGLNKDEIILKLNENNIDLFEQEKIITLLNKLGKIKNNKRNLPNKADLYFLKEYLDYENQTEREQIDMYRLYIAQKNLIKELTEKNYIPILVELGLIENEKKETLYEILLDVNKLDILISKVNIKQLDFPDSELNKILKLLEASRYTAEKLKKDYKIEISSTYFKESLKREKEEIKQNKQKTQNKKIISNSKIQYNSNNNSLYKGNSPTIKISDGKEINISHEEAKMIKYNPEAKQNLINTYEKLDELKLLFVWKFRKKLIQTMNQLKGTSGININDSDFINEKEFHKLLNFILEVIGESGDENSLSGTYSKIIKLNGGGMLNNKENFTTGFSNIGQKFYEYGYIGRNSFDTVNQNNLLNYKNILNNKKR